jgi:hypothetical protein
MIVPKISAMTFDGFEWSGWSNANGQKHLASIEDAVSKIKNDPELDFRIIDADNLIIYVSDLDFSERAIRSAKANFGVDISNIIVGFPL